MSIAIRITLAAISGMALGFLPCAAYGFYVMEAGMLPMFATAAMTIPAVGLALAIRG